LPSEFEVTYRGLPVLPSIVISFLIYVLKGNGREKYSESSFSFRYRRVEAAPKKPNVSAPVLCPKPLIPKQNHTRTTQRLL